MTDYKHLLHQRITTSEQNAVFAHSDGGRWRVTNVIFVEPGVKVDRTYYFDFLMSQQLLPPMRHVSSEFIFQKTVPNNIGHAMFSDVDISQGSVATPLGCDGSETTFLLQISWRVY